MYIRIQNPKNYWETSWVTSNKRACKSMTYRLFGDRVGIRTPNLLIRSEVLYPVELHSHFPWTIGSNGGQRYQLLVLYQILFYLFQKGAVICLFSRSFWRAAGAFLQPKLAVHRSATTPRLCSGGNNPWTQIGGLQRRCHRPMSF
jgi:hypothetical protein